MKPLIIFPTPEKRPHNTRNGWGTGGLKTPDRKRQGARLSPRLKELEDGFNERRADIQEAPEGFAPERMLVLETVAHVDTLKKAAAKLPGFEFLTEQIGEISESDEDFFYEDDRSKKVKSHLYLSMTNEAALKQLFKMWRDFTTKNNYKFPRGLTPFRDVFSCLKDIRYWDTSDRIRNTGLLEDWSFRLEYQSEQTLPVEIELWSRSSQTDRDASENRVRELVDSMGGTVLGAVCLADISYHALLAEVLPGDVEQLLETGDQDISLLRSGDIMHFWPVGQCKTDPLMQDQNITLDDTEFEIEELKREPIVALLDGLPLENHGFTPICRTPS